MKSILIDPNNIWLLWSIILLIASISIYLENQYNWASKISGAVIALVIAALLSNLGITHRISSLRYYLVLYSAFINTIIIISM